MKQVIDLGETSTFDKGTNLISVGSDFDFFILVLKGEVKVFLSGPSGKRKTLYWIREGETCFLGVNCLLSSDSYPANAVTTKETKAVILPKSKFNVLMDDAEFRSNIFKMQSQRLTETLSLLKEVSFQGLDYRVARYLIRKSVDSYVTFTHLEAADDIGSSRERVSKAIKKFEQEGLLIKIEKGKYSLNIDKIEKNYSM